MILSGVMSRAKSPTDEEMTPQSILSYFRTVPDPRITRARLHPLSSILVLSLMAVIGGADSFVAIEQYGLANEEWLRSFLDLPNGIPSHDTLGRVFAMLEPKALQTAFREWMMGIAQLTQGGVLAIDGKTLRRSLHKGGGGFVHMVSAWSSANRVVLGQLKTEEKSNEITAIPKLLDLLKLDGTLVTIDAMGCQRDIAAKIVDASGDYRLAFKDNQPTLAAEVAGVLEAAAAEPATMDKMDYCYTQERSHGREEIRRCWTTTDLQGVTRRDDWKGLRSLVFVESTRTVDDKTTTEHRHYICSRASISATEALGSARSHWGIENELHWVLDVAFREDDCRIRVGNAAENFAVLRHIALNLLKTVKGPKVGIKNRRLRAGWDTAFLLQVLGALS